MSYDKNIKKGKDGTVTETKHKKKDAIVKTFRKNKNKDEVVKEIYFNKKAHRIGIAPEIYDYGTNKNGQPYIIMQQLGKTLLDHLKNSGKLSLDHQRQIISLLETLDKNKIFHGDISLLNFMTGKEDPNKLYIIDFGMSKRMDDDFIQQYGKDANCKLGISVFILKIREQIPSFEPSLLLKKVNQLLKV